MSAAISGAFPLTYYGLRRQKQGAPMTQDKQAQRCKETIYVRDTYRYTGGRHRFKMHYTKQQCSRRGTRNGYCWQHALYCFGKEQQQ